MESLVSFFIALAAAPLLPGLILKVKAWFVGKKGPPLLIRYYSLVKLLRKGAVYSDSAGFVFRLGPLISCAAAVMALAFFPFAGIQPLIAFDGDIIVLAYILATGRFFTMLAALDTASPFEGMGAAREAFFSTLAEVALFVLIIFFWRVSGGLSLAGWFTGAHPVSFAGAQGALLLLVIVSLFMLLLAENSRVPVDDPATHLELTMIHEAMILDHSGPDLALIELGAFCKLFFYAAFVAALFLPPWPLAPIPALALFYALVVLVYLVVGVIESSTARLRMDLAPRYILTSFAVAFFALILTVEFFP
ncbi:MAG: NADH-quinone oxidoreductase subunit H [Desulfobulbaceae bacterium]|nr:NADH-quinone oxidoreductase subunit H [Desulfobulbaceae bacterium]